MNIFRITVYIIAISVVSTLMGCAKFPSTPPTSGKQLVITLKVQGRINPIDQENPRIRRHYFIAIDNDGDPNIGPQAGIGGNGWVTSEDAVNSIGVTSYIRYDSANPGGSIYNILPGSYFLNTTIPQPPIHTELLEGESTLRFVIDFNQIATEEIPADEIQQLDINFITAKTLDVSGSNFTIFGRELYGLGPSGADYFTINTNDTRPYSGDNADRPAVTDPDLEIIYFEVQVQPVSSG